MKRRSALKVFSGAGAGFAAAIGGSPGPLQAAQQAARRGLPPLKITDVKVILTQPGPDQLVIVKVLTSEAGLYGVGSATPPEPPFAVATPPPPSSKPSPIGPNLHQIG